MIKVSIIIPIYHVEQYLTMCLDSVVSQTMTDNIECILVDDCGNDKSMEIAKSYVANYHGNIKFNIVERKQNGGLSAARNSGIDAACGEYVYFLDSDDEITESCMEKMWAQVEKYGKVDLVQGAFFEDIEEADTISDIEFVEYSNDKRQIKTFLLQYLGDIVGAQSRLIKLSFLKEHNLYFEEGIIHEDNLWTFFLAKYVKSMAYCNICTYFHRYNPNSITKNVNVQKEYISYKHIIRICCNNIDPYLPGTQKELMLNNLITVLNNQYYTNDNERKQIIDSFLYACSPCEKILLPFYIKLSNSFIKNKFLHLLIRIFKVND